MVKEELSIEALHDEAIRNCGHDDFGDSDYHEGLEVLIAAAKKSSRRDAIAPRLKTIAVNALSSRLSSQSGWKARPEVLANKITKPVIITGLPRSGTTILHLLMSVDPQFQWTPRWIGEAPMVRPLRDKWSNHVQYKAANDRLEAVFAANPGLRAAHDMGADLADECITVMVQSFVSNMFNSTLPLPEYREFWYQADEEPSYRRYKDNLRLIGADTPDATWLLKNPSHTFGMAPLLKTFPDARVIILHRNPVETIASGASLTWRNADFWRKSETGPIRLDIYARAVERMAQARQDKPDADIFDVHYRALVDDKLGTVRAIYHHFGLTLLPEVEEQMRNFIADNPQGKHGKHNYSADEFGITDDEVRSRFADYIDQFNLD